MPQDVYGLLIVDSLTIAFPNITRARFNELYKRYGRQGVIEFQRLTWASLPHKDREDLITEQHEADHFAILTSTPAGLLIWRLYQIITREVSWLARTFDKYGIPLSARERGKQSLPDWLEHTGVDRLAAVPAAPGTPPQEVPAILAHQFIKPVVIPDLRSTMLLLDMMTCEDPGTRYAKLRRGEFAELINRAFSCMARRADVECEGTEWRGHWVSVAPDELMFPPGNAINLATVFELLAYTQERQYMRVMNASDDDMDRHLHNVVPPAYRAQLTHWLKCADEHEDFLRQGLVDSLLGRIDVAAIGGSPPWSADHLNDEDVKEDYDICRAEDVIVPGKQQVLLIENEWPAFRLERLKEFQMLVPREIRTMITLDTISSRKHVYGPGSRWEYFPRPDEDPVLANLPYEVHMKRCAEAIRRGIGLRCKSLKSFLTPPPRPVLKGEYLQSVLLYETSDQFYPPSHQPGYGLWEMASAIVFERYNTILMWFAKGELPADPIHLENYLRATADKVIASIKVIVARQPAGAVNPALMAELEHGLRAILPMEFFQKIMRIRLK